MTAGCLDILRAALSIAERHPEQNREKIAELRRQIEDAEAELVLSRIAEAAKS